MVNSLYETDYEQWLENQAIALNSHSARQTRDLISMTKIKQEKAIIKKK